MKKIITLTSVLVLAACNGAYHNGKVGMTISNPDIQFTPQEARISVDTENKITGFAECPSSFWIFNSAPERQTYGAKLQTSDGIIASSACVAAAIYDATSKTDADIIVAPQYTSIRSGTLCFGYRCLFGTTKVLVKGFAGKITSIREMDRGVVQDKQKQNAPTTSVLSFF